MFNSKLLVYLKALKGNLCPWFVPSISLITLEYWWTINCPTGFRDDLSMFQLCETKPTLEVAWKARWFTMVHDSGAQAESQGRTCELQWCLLWTATFSRRPGQSLGLHASLLDFTVGDRWRSSRFRAWQPGIIWKGWPLTQQRCTLQCWVDGEANKRSEKTLRISSMMTRYVRLVGHWKKDFCSRCSLTPALDSKWVRLYGWWFDPNLVGLEHQFYFPMTIGLLIIPIDEHIFFRGVNQPPTSNIQQSVFWVVKWFSMISPGLCGTQSWI